MMTHTPTFMKQVLFGCSLMAALATACSGGADRNAASQPLEISVPISTEIVSARNVDGIDQFPATVVPLNETELRAEVSGYITRIYVADGATVSQGQKLYEIDHVRYSAAKEQAEASVAIAEANLARVKRDVERYRSLAEQDAIARQILDNAETELSNSEAQLIQAKAALTRATTDLNRSVITAPFAGTIGISSVRMGALVSAGSTLLNTISSTHPIGVDFQVNERVLPRFVSLLGKGVAQDSSLALILPGGNVYPGSGQVTAIDRAIDPATGTITIRASFPNQGGTLRAGMNVNIRNRYALSGERITIPHKAIEDQLGTTNVYVVNDSSRVEQRQVRLGIKIGDRVVVEEGLAAGERIAVDGIINLQQGSKVQTEQ